MSARLLFGHWDKTRSGNVGCPKKSTGETTGEEMWLLLALFSPQPLYTPQTLVTAVGFCRTSQCLVNLRDIL